MKYLLDTQVLIWIFGEKNRLTNIASEIIKDKTNSLFVRKVSFWEAAIKVNIGKLTLPFELETLAKEALLNKIIISEIEINHISNLGNLQFHHRDPFDRLILSKAMVDK
ncbi:type II toxin-antitoxin system VapC family toxin [Membranicola marinus]|uniref:Type II toxin-antitoxin system VapC family toxin n=1 Tax=Membranihabitans marinus TaxID=1227546 RepID=A0A953HPS3_9BACT|nr:type II toxin-antitoxin system VapC family toxin [Membranihabitans marinus]MBY5958583.1 type II toxin-antitoxin system VapC family toxin [Membranihabitans marinus]